MIQLTDKVIAKNIERTGSLENPTHLCSFSISSSVNVLLKDIIDLLFLLMHETFRRQEIFLSAPLELCENQQTSIVCATLSFPLRHQSVADLPPADRRIALEKGLTVTL